MTALQLLERTMRAIPGFGSRKEPEALGLWDMLTDEQISIALSYDGDDTMGDPEFERR